MHATSHSSVRDSRHSFGPDHKPLCRLEQSRDNTSRTRHFQNWRRFHSQRTQRLMVAQCGASLVCGVDTCSKPLQPKVVHETFAA